MIIEIKLFATFSKYLNNELISNGTMEVPSVTTVNDIISSLKIPPEQVRLIFVNGQHANTTTLLKDNDRLGLFPPVGGG